MKRLQASLGKSSLWCCAVSAIVMTGCSAGSDSAMTSPSSPTTSSSINGADPSLARQPVMGSRGVGAVKGVVSALLSGPVSLQVSAFSTKNRQVIPTGPSPLSSCTSTNTSTIVWSSDHTTFSVTSQGNCTDGSEPVKIYPNGGSIFVYATNTMGEEKLLGSVAGTGTQKLSFTTVPGIVSLRFLASPTAPACSWGLWAGATSRTANPLIYNATNGVAIPGEALSGWFVC